MGISRGSEGLLAAASHLPDLDVAGLVLVSPSHVAWQAIGESGEIPNTSSWTSGAGQCPSCRSRGQRSCPSSCATPAGSPQSREKLSPRGLDLAAEHVRDDALPWERMGAFRISPEEAQMFAAAGAALIDVAGSRGAGTFVAVPVAALPTWLSSRAGSGAAAGRRATRPSAR